MIPTVIQPLRDEWDAVRTAAVTHAQRGRPQGGGGRARSVSRPAVRRAGARPGLRLAATSCTSRSNTSSGWRAKCSPPTRASPSGRCVSKAATPSIRTSCWASRSTRAPRPSPSWCCGSATCNGTSARAATCQSARAGHQELQEHRMPRRRAQLEQHADRARRERQARHPLGRPHHEAAPVTGEEVPDETARSRSSTISTQRKRNGRRRSLWLAIHRLWAIKNATALGTGYTEALRSAFDSISESSDFVMYWWDSAATLLSDGELVRFGLITTNSIRQRFNRRVLDSYLKGEPAISIVYAVPDHPWVDTSDGADVRVSMTVGIRGTTAGILDNRIFTEAGPELTSKSAVRNGTIQADLTIGADIASAIGLEANRLYLQKA